MGDIEWRENWQSSLVIGLEQWHGNLRGDMGSTRAAAGSHDNLSVTVLMTGSVSLPHVSCKETSTRIQDTYLFTYAMCPSDHVPCHRAMTMQTVPSELGLSQGAGMGHQHSRGLISLWGIEDLQMPTLHLPSKDLSSPRSLCWPVGCVCTSGCPSARTRYRHGSLLGARSELAPPHEGLADFSFFPGWKV